MKDGNDWVINGSKMWITNSYEADFFLIFANVDPSKGYKGITCFIATKDMGITIAKKEQKLGIRASSTCALSFDDLRVPAENVLGGEGSLEVGQADGLLAHASGRLVADGDERADCTGVDGLDAAHKVQLRAQGG